MKLILLGTGGFLPTDTAQTACYFLPEVGILLDAGHGLYRLRRYLQISSLDIYLSHAHADHTSGLDYIFASFVAWYMHMSPRQVDGDNIEDFIERANDSLHRTRIHADEATLQVVQEKYRPFNYEWHSLQERESLTGGGWLTHFLMETDTRGYRLDWPNHSLAYITDTIARPTSSYVEKITGVDVLLHDCYGPDSSATLVEKIGHSHVSAVAQVAAQARVKRLILIHHSPIEMFNYEADLDHARQIFPHIEVGYDGMELDF